MNTLTTQPILYSPTFEIPAEDESETVKGLIETLQSISETTSKDYDHAVRSVHAKCHGLLRGKLYVRSGLPEQLAQGLFANQDSYPVVIRFSTSPGDLMTDRVSTPRGMALKVLNVQGPFVNENNNLESQDFLLVNGPAFLKPDPKAFLSSLKLLAKTTDKAEGFKEALSTALRGTEKAIEKVSEGSPTIKSLGGHPMTNLLGESFFTQVPILYGRYMAKLSVVPVSQNMTALTDAPLPDQQNPNSIRDAVVNYFENYDGEWEVRVQLNTNLETMPIEDASVIWPEEESPYITVATIHVEKQLAWDEEHYPKIEDSLSFSPWNALAAHRPLGGVMRARKDTYKFSSSFRHQFNGCPMGHGASSSK